MVQINRPLVTAADTALLQRTFRGTVEVPSNQARPQNNLPSMLLTEAICAPKSLRDETKHYWKPRKIFASLPALQRKAQHLRASYSSTTALYRPATVRASRGIQELRIILIVPLKARYLRSFLRKPPSASRHVHETHLPIYSTSTCHFSFFTPSLGCKRRFLRSSCSSLGSQCCFEAYFPLIGLSSGSSPPPPS